MHFIILSETGTQAKITGLTNDVHKEQRYSRKLRYERDMTKDKTKKNRFVIETQQSQINKQKKQIKKLNKALKSKNYKLNKKGILDVCKKNLSLNGAEWLIERLDKHFVGCTSKILSQNKAMIDKINQQQIHQQRHNPKYILLQALEFYDSKLTKSQIQQLRNTTNNNFQSEGRNTKSVWSNGYSKDVIIPYQEMMNSKDMYLKQKGLISTNQVYMDIHDLNAEYAVFADSATIARNIYELTISSNCNTNHYLHHLTNISHEELQRDCKAALCIMWDGGTASKVFQGTHIMVASAKFSGWRKRFKASPKTAFFFLMANRSEDQQMTNTVLLSEIQKISQIKEKAPIQISDAYGRFHRINLSNMPILVCFYEYIY